MRASEDADVRHACQNPARMPTLSVTWLTCPEAAAATTSAYKPTRDRTRYSARSDNPA